jgi:hypothetical protein
MPDHPAKPEVSASDVVHAVVKGAVSAVPVVGGVLSETLSLVFSPPLEKRREKWIETLAGAIEEIKHRLDDFSPDKLSQNEAFVTTAMHASQIASRTHQEEKLRALRNAIVNAALPDAPDETKQQIFLEHVDSLTPWHLRILAFFESPESWFQRHNIPRPNITAGGQSHILEAGIPELRGQREFYDQIIKDLEARGLMPGGGIHTMVSERGLWQARVTTWGREFLRFISARA